VGVRFGAKFNRTRAKHFRARFKLNMNLKPNRCDVVHARKKLTTNKHESTRIREDYARLSLLEFVFIRGYSCLLPLNGEIQRTLEIEFFDPIGKCRIICRVNDPLILEKIEKAPLRDHFRDIRVVS
jgi:hypothetical protein